MTRIEKALFKLELKHELDNEKETFKQRVIRNLKQQSAIAVTTLIVIMFFVLIDSI